MENIDGGNFFRRKHGQLFLDISNNVKGYHLLGHWRALEYMEDLDLQKSRQSWKNEHTENNKVAFSTVSLL